MKLNEILNEDVPWKQHPTQRGVKIRILSPEDQKRELEKQKAKENKQQERDYFKTPEGKLQKQRLKPIDAEQIAHRLKSLIKKIGFAGDIEDIMAHRDGLVRVNNIPTAAVEFDLHVVYDTRDLGGDSDRTEDALTVVIYRDVEQPNKLRASYRKLEKK